MDKARFILEYLTELWSKKHESNIDAKIEDIRTLLNYLNDLNLEEFISELYLNIENLKPIKQQMQKRFIGKFYRCFQGNLFLEKQIISGIFLILV